MNENDRERLEHSESDIPQEQQNVEENAPLDPPDTTSPEESTEAKPPKAPRKRRLLTFLIIAAAITVVCVGVAIGLGIYLSRPEVVVIRATQNFASDLARREEFAPISDMLQGGSLNIEIAAQADNQTVEVGGKIYFKEEELFLQNGFFGVNDTKISASAYLCDDYFYVTDSDFLDEAYGFKKENAANLFDDSVFAPDSGSEFALDNKTATALRNILENIEDEDAQKDAEKKLKKFSERYYEFFLKSLQKNANWQNELRTVKVGNEKIKARVIIVTLDQDGLLAIWQELYAELHKDQELREFFVEQVYNYEDFLDAMGSPEKTPDANDLYDELLDKFDRALDEAEVSKKDFEYEFKVVTPKHSSKLLQCTLSYKSGVNKQNIFSLDLGKDGIEKTDRIYLELNDGATSFEFTILQNDDSRYVAEFEHSYPTYEGGQTVTRSERVFKFTHDKDEDTFKLNFYDGATVLEGDLSINKGGVAMDIDSITQGTETIPFYMRVVIDRKDKLPEVLEEDEIKNIFKVSEDELKKAMEKLKTIS